MNVVVNDKKSLILTHKYLSSLLASRKLGKLESKIKNYKEKIQMNKLHFHISVFSEHVNSVYAVSEDIFFLMT